MRRSYLQSAAIAATAVATAVALGSGTAHAAPSAPADTVTATASDGSTIGWTIPDTGAANRSTAPAESSTFDTTSTEPGEVSTIITIPNASAPQSYSFDLSLPDGAVATAQDDGSISVNNAEGKLVGGFKTPWAKDATGAPVPTTLSVSDNVLEQTVDFGPDTAFPVTADPHFTWGIVTGHVYFNRQETRILAVGGGVVSWLPTPVTVWGGRGLAAWAGTAAATNQCVFVKVGGSAPVAGIPIEQIGYYNDGYCT